MDTSLILEIHIFLTVIYSGLIVGFTYDLYRTVRYFFKPNKIITYLGDLLFWTAIAYIFFYTIIKTNLGEIRGYILFGFFIGIIIYYKLFSKYIYRLCIKLGKVLSTFIKGIFSLTLSPFKFLKKKSSPIFKKIRKVPAEIIQQTKKYKKIISSKK
jgi:spore cortex biosynthesis protein YabQ